MNIFNSLPKFQVYLENTAGQRSGPFPGIFTQDAVMLAVEDLTAEAGDTLIKNMPDGSVQRFRVTAVTFAEGFGSLPAYHHLALDAA